MFEYFTDTARRVVILAQEQAKMLQHTQIESRHVLLALLWEGDVIFEVLDDAGLDPKGIVERTKAELGVGPHPVAGHMPFTPRVRAAMTRATSVALRGGERSVRPEHIWAALMLESEDCVRLAGTAPVLNATPAARTEAPAPSSTAIFALYTHAARRVIVLANEHAKMLNHHTVEPRHLLLGLLHDDFVASLIRHVGADPERVAEQTRAELGTGDQQDERNIPFSTESREVLLLVGAVVKEAGDTNVSPVHLLVALLRESAECARIVGAKADDLLL